MSQMSTKVKLFDILLLLTYELSYTEMNVITCPAPLNPTGLFNQVESLPCWMFLFFLFNWGESHSTGVRIYALFFLFIICENLCNLWIFALRPLISDLFTPWNFYPACPVKSGNHFTGVALGDGTGALWRFTKWQSANVPYFLWVREGRHQLRLTQ